MEALESLKIKEDNDLFNDLKPDFFSDGKKYNLDLFLEIFKFDDLFKKRKSLLMEFSLDKVKLPNYQIEFSEYSKILNLIEENPEIIYKNCSGKENIDIYYKKFYSLLLYFRFNYEKNKIEELLLKKNLWVYFKEIIPNYYNIFDDLLQIPIELLNELIKIKFPSTNIIIHTLSNLKICENLLIFINSNIDIIDRIIKENNKKKYSDEYLYIDQYTSPRDEDNFEIILTEIYKLINCKSEHKSHIKFGNKFFYNYANFFNMKNLKNLISLKKSCYYQEKQEKIKKEN